MPNTPLSGVMVMTVVLRTPRCGSGSAKHSPFRRDGHDSRSKDTKVWELECRTLTFSGLMVMTVVLRTPGCRSGSARHSSFRRDDHDSCNEDSSFCLLSCGELQARGVGVP